MCGVRRERKRSASRRAGRRGVRSLERARRATLFASGKVKHKRTSAFRTRMCVMSASVRNVVRQRMRFFARPGKLRSGFIPSSHLRTVRPTLLSPSLYITGRVGPIYLTTRLPHQSASPITANGRTSPKNACRIVGPPGQRGGHCDAPSGPVSHAHRCADNLACPQDHGSCSWW